MGIREHRESAAKTVKIGVITLSSTRTRKDDESGRWIREQAGKRGCEVVFYEIAPDDADAITKTVREAIHAHAPGALLLTGGTGIGSADVTVEAVRPLFEKELTAFGTLFASLSHQEIGPAAILSRAAAGVIGKTILFCMPGSIKACKLACNMLILPELGHLVKHVHE